MVGWNRICHINLMDIKKIIGKVTLPVAIVISAVVLAIGFYAVQYNKQQSIEKQQILKLQEDGAIEKVKAEQAQKEYVAKRKKDCYDVLERERKAFSNTRDGEYDEEADVCRITYKAVQGEWEDTDCEMIKPSEALSESTYFWRQYWNCKNNIFDKEY